MIYYRRHVVVMMMSIVIAALFQHTIYIQPVSSLVFEFTGDEKEMGFSLEDWEIHEFGDHEDDGNRHGDDDEEDDEEVWTDDKEVWNDDKEVWNDDDDEVWNDDDDNEKHNNEKCRSISDMICSNDDFTILCTVMKQIGYDSIFDDDSSLWTLFAPTNEAFSNLSMDMTNDILSSNENTEYVLLYHTVDDIELSSEDLECTELVPMANGKDTRTACLNGDKVYQKGSGNNDDDALPEIVEVDIPACNGIIHVINQVILPKKLPDNNVHHEDENDHHEDDHDDEEHEDDHDDHDEDEDHHDNDEPAYTPTQKPNDDHDDFFSPTTPVINYPHEKPDHKYESPHPTPYPTTRKPTNKPTKPPIATLYPTPYPTTSKPTNKPTKKPPTAKSTFAYPEEDPNYVEEDKPYTVVVDFVDGRQQPPPQQQQQQCASIATIICNTDGFKLLCEAIKMVGLIDFLELSSWTLFAPTDEAFEKLVLATQQGDNPNKLNPNNMSNLLFFHLVENSVLEFNDLICNKWLKMSNEGFTFTHCRGLDKYQVGRGNGLKTESIISLKDSPIILKENIIACNGIIHSIDTVMLPIWW